jgi:hypothetical protein
MDQQLTSMSDEAMLDRLFRQADEMQSDLDLHAAREEYLARHPDTAAGISQANGSNKAQGKAHVETNLVPTFVKFLAKAAKDRGHTGMSASTLNRRLARVDYLGREYFETLIAQPRRRRGIAGFLQSLVTEQPNLCQTEREDAVEQWLAEEPTPPRKSNDDTTWRDALARIKDIIGSLNDREQDEVVPALRQHLNALDAARYG